MTDPIALVDLDGTLADYDGAIARELARIASPTDPPYHSFGPDGHPPWIDARRHLVSSVPGFWRNLAPLEAGQSILAALRGQGFQINVLTKGPSTKPAAWMEKLEWCRVHVPDASVSITEDKSLSYGRVLVDDWPPYFMSWLAHRPRGLVVVPAQPWNEGAEDLAPSNVFRYVPGEGLNDLHRLLRAAAQRGDGVPFDVREVLSR